MAENVIGEISTTSCTLEWVINYDSVSCKNVGDLVKSPAFTTINIGKSCQWQLWLYPNGDVEKAKNFFSISLCIVSEDEVNAQASFKMIDNKGEVVAKKSLKENVYKHKSAKSNWGIRRFADRDCIEKRNIDGGDKLTFVCEMIVRENEEQNNILRTDVYCKHRQLIADLEQLMNNTEFSDVKFTIGDQELQAHKNILSQRSLVFAAMFRCEMREKHESQVIVTDVRHEVFLEMLRYIYAEKVNGIEKIAGELLSAADKYSIDGLKLMCVKSLNSTMTAGNVLENLILADRHTVEGLKAKCIEFIVTKAANIVKKPEFRQLPFNTVCDVCSALVDQKK